MERQDGSCAVRRSALAGEHLAHAVDEAVGDAPGVDLELALGDRLLDLLDTLGVDDRSLGDARLGLGQAGRQRRELTFSVPAETVVSGFAGLRGRVSAAVEGAIALPELSIFMAQFPYRVALTFSSARSRGT